MSFHDLFDPSFVPDLDALLDAAPSSQAEILARWRTHDRWLDAVTTAARELEGPRLGALWQIVASDIERVDGEAAWVAQAPVLIEHAIVADDLVLAEAWARKASLLAARIAGATSDEAVRARLHELSLHASLGRHDEGALAELAGATQTPALRRRALLDLGIARFALGRHASALDAWHEAEAGPVVTAHVGVAVLGREGASVLDDAIAALRRQLQLEVTPEHARTWGVGGPFVAVVLHAMANELERTAHPDAAALRAEVLARFERGVPTEPDPGELFDELDQLASFTRHPVDLAALRALRPRR